MGPPREHGGMGASGTTSDFYSNLLQWGRRVNTAECALAVIANARHYGLQWGRRVNTAECLARLRWRTQRSCFNGAAA